MRFRHRPIPSRGSAATPDILQLIVPGRAVAGDRGGIAQRDVRGEAAADKADAERAGLPAGNLEVAVEEAACKPR